MKSVRPGLYIGSQYDAFYLLSGQYKGVTHILSMVPLCHEHKPLPSEPPRDKGVFHKAAAELYMKQPEFSGNIVRMVIPIEDSVDEKLLDYLEAALLFIDQARGQDGIVLVHCGGGVSRSASVVTAYLMWKEGLSLTDALGSLKKSSPAVNPNKGFMEQLKLFETRGFGAKNRVKDHKQKKPETKKPETKTCRLCKKVAPIEDFLRIPA